MTEIIQINNLSKKFGTHQALNDVSFTVNDGEVVGFIGPNGAGKSTTIRILLGIIKRDAGQVKIFDKDAWQDSLAIHQRTSYVPGDVALWGNLTGGEIIDLFLALHGGGNQTKKAELIKRFELDPKKKAKNYSKGNRQKVGLIAALAVESDLYIFDEPTSGLDPLMESVFQTEVAKLKQQGKAILLSSHILSEVERLADKVVIIRQGQIVETGALEQLRHLTRSQVHLTTPDNLSDLIQLTGLYDFKQVDQAVSFAIDQSQISQLMQQLGQYTILNIEFLAPTLEDLFMRHYES